ncbi:hypothetical protein L1887_23388 [Cichorium endivia]|nr:hypothetical protein L1887_23388 [Cichorium endivia]
MASTAFWWTCSDKSARRLKKNYFIQFFKHYFHITCLIKIRTLSMNKYPSFHFHLITSNAIKEACHNF